MSVDVREHTSVSVLRTGEHCKKTVSILLNSHPIMIYNNQYQCHFSSRDSLRLGSFRSSCSVAVELQNDESDRKINLKVSPAFELIVHLSEKESNRKFLK